MNASPIVRFSIAVLVGGVLVSCQSVRPRAQHVQGTKLLYSAAKVQPHDDPPGIAPRGKDAEREGLVSRGLHGLAKGLSVVGRVPALPVTLMFEAIVGNEDAVSSAGRFFTEPLP
jgi:hypothetical protein